MARRLGVVAVCLGLAVVLTLVGCGGDAPPAGPPEDGDGGAVFPSRARLFLNKLALALPLGQSEVVRVTATDAEGR